MNAHLTGAYPLSPMQQGMLFHHLKEPRSGVDIEQLVVHLTEAVDAARMRAAWQWLCERHDILRTQFVWSGVTEPQQQVLASVSLPFAVEDGSSLAVEAQRERLQSFLQTDRVQGFELDRAPLLRLTLFQWGENSASLVWTFHHALLDGRTFPTLLREVFEVYAELGAGSIVARPAPPAYRSYIEWLQTRDFVAADAFWKHYLKGFTAPTPLVVDRVASAGDSAYRHGESWERLECDTTARLRSLAAQHGVTMNSFVQAAWAILLHRYSGETDIVFGATRSCRKSSVPAADETIGLFINTVPVRIKVSNEAAALSVVKAARRDWVELRAFEHTPLVRVKAASEVSGAQSLFDSLVVFENYRLDSAMRALGGEWAARRVDLHELTNFPITLAAYDGEELSFKIEFDRRRLDQETVTRMLGHLRRLLEGIAANENTLVAELPLLSEDERRELLSGFAAESTRAASHLPADGGTTLRASFEAQVARRPDAIALTCEGEALTYAQLNACANRIARELVKLGVGPETLVGLCLDRTNDLVAALIGILKSGGAYVPIDAAYPAERTAFILEDAHAPVLLTERKLVAAMPATSARVLCVDEILAQSPSVGDEQNLPHTAGPDNVAYVIYTSGTTGRPKGSLITHRNVMRLFTSTEHWYQFNERDVWTLFHSCAFDFSVWEIWGALLYGGRVVVVPYLTSRSPEAFYELLVRERVTMLNQTPSAFRQLIQAEESVGQKELALRFVIFGGEALEMQSLRPWFERHGDEQPRLVNMYGITETTVHVTYRPISKDDLNSGSVIGVPIPDLRIYILDMQGQLVPRGVPGEVYVGGAGLARGYLRRPDLTAQRFVPNHLTNNTDERLYRTGDRARFLPGGDIEYLGRVDEQVKIRGFRIELGEIESVLCEHPAVRGAAVMTREDATGFKHLAAYVVSSGDALDAAVLRAHLKKKLPDYMIPSAFVSLESLPLTSHGKVDRKALPAPNVAAPAASAPYAPPQTEMERSIAEIWKSLLNVERVSVEENFFDLGGHSLLLVQLHARLREKLQTQFPMVALFEHSTIRALAQYLDEPVAAGVAADRGVQDRAARQKEALAGFRNRLKKDGR